MTTSIKKDSIYAIVIVTEWPSPGSAVQKTVTFKGQDNDHMRYNQPVEGPAQSDAFNEVITKNVPAPGTKHTFLWTNTAPNQDAILWSVASEPTFTGTTTVQEVTVSSPESTTIVNSATNTASNGVNSSAISTTGTSTVLASPTGVVSSSTPQPIPDGDGGDGDSLSNGAVAGVAIGCLIAGALIAGLVFWFFFRRSKKAKGISRDQEANAIALMRQGRGAEAKILSLESDSAMTTAMEYGVPQPLEDKAISGEISKISNSIKNHVQSFYHSGLVSPGLIDYDDLQALGRDLPISIGTLSTLLGNSTTREMALRFCIAWVVVSHMSPGNAPNFLPPEVASCFQSMSVTDNANQAQALSLAKWRAITAEQMQTSYVKNAFSPSDARLRNIQEALRILDHILLPYADSRLENEQRRRNLEEILKRAAMFALTLFSQPSTWDFDWKKDESVRTESFCVFPSLVQVVNEKGAMVRPSQPFSEAVIRQLDE